MSLEHYFSEALTDPKRQEQLEELYPAFPFDGPGMPPPGVDFIKAATALGDEIDEKALQKKKTIPVSKHLDYLYRRAMYDRDFALTIAGKRGPFLGRFVPGHIIANPDDPESVSYKPAPARIMVVGKFPGNDNLAAQNCTAGSAMEEFFSALAEAGVSGFEMTTWYGVFVTTGTPPEVVTKLQAELARILKLPDVQAKLKGLGGEPGNMSIEQFTNLNRQEYERFGKLIRQANIKMQ